jgi:hypothetical protein
MARRGTSDDVRLLATRRGAYVRGAAVFPVKMRYGSTKQSSERKSGPPSGSSTVYAGIALAGGWSSQGSLSLSTGRVTGSQRPATPIGDSVERLRVRFLLPLAFGQFRCARGLSRTPLSGRRVLGHRPANMDASNPLSPRGHPKRNSRPRDDSTPGGGAPPSAQSPPAWRSDSRRSSSQQISNR